MLKTAAYAAPSPKAPIAPYSFDRREPREYDVLIDIKFCGICHTDIHQVRDEWGQGIYPMVPGHEITGVVTKVGSKVTKFKTGDKVGVGCFVDSCRACEYCRQGLQQYCDKGAIWTYNAKDKDGTPTQGGYSDKIVVDENYVLKIPGNLALDAAAPLLCAGITLYSPLKHWNAGPGKKVAIIGLGGLGHMGVKIGHALGAQVSVISQSMKKAEDAKRLGADQYFATQDPATFDKLKKHFDLIINTVSSATDWTPLLEMLRIDGTMVSVGAPDKPIPLGVFPLLMGRRSVAGSAIGGIPETQEMLDFCGRNNIVSDIEITPIQKVNEAYERILKSDVRYRFVIDMATLKGQG